MTTESILPADWTPVLGDQNDGTPGITTAVSIYSGVPGHVSAVTFRTTATVGGIYTGGAWLVNSADEPSPSGAELQFQTYPGVPAAAERASIVFDPPVAVAANTLYRFGVHNSQGRYVYRAGEHSSAKTSDLGNLHAPADGDNPTGLGPVSQATFSIGSTIAYPANDGNGASYGVDVLFIATPPPTEGAAAIDIEVTVSGLGEAADLPPAEGAADFPLTLAPAASGIAPAVAPSAGAVDFPLTATTAALGETPARPLAAAAPRLTGTSRPGRILGTSREA